MTGRLEGHVAVVTGAGSGIGRAVVDRFVAEGGRVVALDSDPERVDALAERHGTTVAALAGDVRSVSDNDAAVATALARWERIDSFVANAGLFDFGRPLSALDASDLQAAFHELFGVNVLGPLLGARAAAAALRATGGAIVVTLSCAGLYAGGGGPLYVASKHAGVGVVRQLALELAPEVRVNGVAPGFTHTDLRGLEALDSAGRSLRGASRLAEAAAGNVPLRAVAAPEDHTSLYVLLASAAESAHTTGAVIPSDGGLEVRWPRGGGRS